MERSPEPQRRDDPGVLRRVDPREVWPHGPYEFAPWLEQRATLLGDELGADLTLRTDPRLPVGFLAGDARVPSGSESERVVVLSQLGRADESHLGRLLAGVRAADAQLGVWIALTMAEDQRETVRWLDAHMDIALFGLELSVIAIDDSRPAVGLEAVAPSATWRAPQARASRVGSEASAAAFAPARRVRGTDLRISREEHERRGVPTLRVGLAVDLGNMRQNEIALERLLDERDQIERESGEPLVWERSAESGGGWVGMERSSDSADAEAWARRWEERLEKVLGPRAREIAAILSLGEPAPTAAPVTGS
jgi:hypothetical protein